MVTESHLPVIGVLAVLPNSPDHTIVCGPHEIRDRVTGGEP